MVHRRITGNAARAWPGARRVAAPLGVAALAAAGLVAMPAAGARAAGPAALKQVSYLGYRFEVPRAWPVINLAAHPGTCVRFDRHAVYLGTPAATQDCPSMLVGATGALLVQPAAGAATGAVENVVARQITVVTARARLTATYGTDRATVESILASASLARPAPESPGAGVLRGAPAAPPSAPRVTMPPTITAGATNYTGRGFDACAAPSASTMGKWLASSPYRAIGIYIGGSDRACSQANLTAGWVSKEAAAGWHYVPLYVGPQASFGELSSPASQAVNAAKDAVAQARILGFGKSTPIYYDMEAYPPGQTKKALTFASAWTTQLHALGYKSGYYSSSLSGVIDLVHNYTNPAYTMPDVIYDALWNGSANTADPILPASAWSGHRRVHQYSGNVNQKYGGVTLNIDQDYLDVQLSGSAPSGGGGGGGGGAGGGITPQSSSAAARSGGAVDAFFRGSNGALWHVGNRSGAGWSRPASIGGSVASQPSAVALPSGEVDAFYRAADGRLAVTVSSGNGWSRPRELSMGRLGSAPQAVSEPAGTVDVFWRGSSDDRVWHARRTPGRGWSGPSSLGGHLAGSPVPAVSDSGTVSVFWRGTNRHLWHTLRGTSGAWRRPAMLHVGRMGAGLHATGQPTGRIDVFWRGNVRANTLWHTVYTHARGWRGPSRLATNLASAPVLVASSRGTSWVFWKGADGRLWRSAESGGGAWGRGGRLSMGKIGGDLFGAGQRSGTVDVFWKGTARPRLWHARFNPATGRWAGPGDLGGSVG